MADKILHKRNLSAGNVPTTSSLDVGELAINVADGKLFLRQSGSIANKIITVGESASFASTASFVTSSNIYGPYGANSIISASYALQALSSSYANFATSASHTLFAETASNALNAQDILIYVLNNSGYNIPKGTVVHITASGNSSDTPRIISASYENDANSANTLGIANESIANGANGYVMTEGVLKGIDTSAFVSGQMIYLGASGSIIGTAPQAPLHAVRLGQVVRVQQNNGSVYVRIDNGYELDELHDVRIMTASLQYGDLLMRSGSVWTNSKQLSGSYGIAGTLSATHVTASDLYAGATYISGSLIVNGQSTFYGTASFINVTASNLFVSESFISVNVFEPVERFGGLKVYDSGSSTATASLAWDSLHNHWVYQNIDGLTYTGGMLLSGPRNTGSLGDEPNLTKWFVPRGDGGDHLENSQIFTSGSITQVTGSLTVTNGVTASLQGTASFATSASYALTASYLDNYIPPFPYTGSALITGSLGVTGSVSFRATNSTTNSVFNLKYSGSNINILDIRGDGRLLLGYSASNNATGGFPQYAIAIGHGAIVGGQSENYGSSIAIGYDAQATAAGGIAIGNITRPSTGIAIGHNVQSRAESVAIAGSTTDARGTVIGFGSSNSGYGGSAIGYDVDNSGGGSFLVGYFHSNSIASSFIWGSNGIKFLVNGNSNLVLSNNSPITEANKASYFDTAATNTITITSGSIPTTTISSSFQLYAATGSVSNNVRPHFRTGNGTTVWLGDESRLFNITASRTIISSSQSTASGSSLTVYGSGSTQPVFTVQGSSGELFSVTDSLTGSLFSVNDISGLPILEVFSDNTTLIGNYLDPMLITTAKVTQTNSGSFTVYSLPTASYDTAFFEYSVKSGSNARAGTIMAIQSGSSVNFTETTTTDFGNTTAVSFTVLVTGSNMALTGSSTTGSWTIKAIVRGL